MGFCISGCGRVFRVQEVASGAYRRLGLNALSGLFFSAGPFPESPIPLN